MKELANEDRMKVMAMYMPCLAMHGKDGPYAIQGVSLSEGMGLFEWDYDSDWWNIDESVKIILTPISEISDEHAIEVAKMCSSYNQFAFSEHQDYVDMVTQDGKDIIKYWNKENGYGFTGNASTIVTVTDFLRSKSYALPYLGQDLYAAGIAVMPKNDGI